MNTLPLVPVLVISALLAASSGTSNRLATQTVGPVIRFDTTLHDFGSIPFGGDGRCAFRFTNTGDAPLIIESFRSSCGCLVPEWDRDPVPPGGVGSVRLRYDTRRMGPFTKSATLTSNATNSPLLVLRIKGIVLPDSSQQQAR